MARDPGLEQVLREQLRDIPHLSEKAMFGGRAVEGEGEPDTAKRKLATGAVIHRHGLGSLRGRWAMAFQSV